MARNSFHETPQSEEVHPYPGSSVYVADDPKGNRWTFLQARPTMR